MRRRNCRMLAANNTLYICIQWGDRAACCQRAQGVFLYGIHDYTDPCWLNENRSFIAYTNAEHRTGRTRATPDEA